MKNEDRMVELLAEMVKNSDRSIAQQKELISEVKTMRNDIHEMRGDISEMKKDFSQVKKDIRKHNVMLAEHSRAIITLAENVDSFSAYYERISELEKKVFKK